MCPVHAPPRETKVLFPSPDTGRLDYSWTLTTFCLPNISSVGEHSLFFQACLGFANGGKVFHGTSVYLPVAEPHFVYSWHLMSRYRSTRMHRGSSSDYRHFYWSMNDSPAQEKTVTAFCIVCSCICHSVDIMNSSHLCFLKITSRQSLAWHQLYAPSFSKRTVSKEASIFSQNTFCSSLITILEDQFKRGEFSSKWQLQGYQRRQS